MPGRAREHVCTGGEVVIRFPDGRSYLWYDLNDGVREVALPRDVAAELRGYRDRDPLSTEPEPTFSPSRPGEVVIDGAVA